METLNRFFSLFFILYFFFTRSPFIYEINSVGRMKIYASSKLLLFCSTWGREDMAFYLCVLERGGKKVEVLCKIDETTTDNESKLIMMIEFTRRIHSQKLLPGTTASYSLWWIFNLIFVIYVVALLLSEQ